MIRAMTAGTIYGKPSQRTGTNGKHFATAKLRADGKDGESVWVSLLGFGEVGERLSALPDGAAIAVSGRAEVRAWSDGQNRHRIDDKRLIQTMLACGGHDPRNWRE